LKNNEERLIVDKNNKYKEAFVLALQEYETQGFTKRIEKKEDTMLKEPSLSPSSQPSEKLVTRSGRISKPINRLNVNPM